MKPKYSHDHAKNAIKRADKKGLFSKNELRVIYAIASAWNDNFRPDDFTIIVHTKELIAACEVDKNGKKIARNRYYDAWRSLIKQGFIELINAGEERGNTIKIAFNKKDENLFLGEKVCTECIQKESEVYTKSVYKSESSVYEKDENVHTSESDKCIQSVYESETRCVQSVYKRRTFRPSVYMNARERKYIKIKKKSITNNISEYDFFAKNRIAFDSLSETEKADYGNRLLAEVRWVREKMSKPVTEQNHFVDANEKVTSAYELIDKNEKQPPAQTLEITALQPVCLFENEKLIQTTTEGNDALKTSVKRKNAKAKSDDLVTRIASGISTEFVNFYFNDFYVKAFGFNYKVRESEKGKEFANCKRFLISAAMDTLNGKKNIAEDLYQERTLIFCKDYLNRVLEAKLHKKIRTLSQLSSTYSWLPQELLDIEKNGIKATTNAVQR
jgi:hypothetical protein